MFSEVLGEVVLTGGIYPVQDTFDHDLFADTFPDAAVLQQLQRQANLGSAGSAADVSATFGSLSGSSSASDDEDHAVYPIAFASGISNAEVYDTLHLYSASLPDGTPVTLDFDLNLSNNTPDNAGADLNPSASAIAKLDAHPQTPGTSIHLEYGNSTFPTSCSRGRSRPTSASTCRSTTKPIRTRPSSQERHLSQQAALSIQPRISVDAANPDVTVTTDSGFDYGLPVPEPSKAASEGVAEAMGLACLAFRSARGRSRRRRRCNDGIDGEAEADDPAHAG